MFDKKLTLHFLSRKSVLIFGFIVDVLNTTSVQVWGVCVLMALLLDLNCNLVLSCKFARILGEREIGNL